MKKLLLLPAFLLFLSLFSSCVQPGRPPVDNAATRTGQNLLSAVSTVMQDYADVQKDGVASLWSISKGANAYHQAVTGVADIKQLIVDWKSTQGDGNFVQRISDLLNNSDASPQTKALVVAKAAEMVAANATTSPPKSTVNDGP